VRVVHVYKDVFPPVAGGVERYIDSIRRFMPDIESDVVVCGRTWRTRVKATAWGKEVLVGEWGRLLSVPLAPTFPLWLARQQPDVVHLHMPNPTGELSVLMTLRATPMVVTYHADVARQAGFNPLYQPMAQACLRRASAVVVTSPRMLKSSPALARWRSKATFVPFAVDLERFDPARVGASERAAIRARFGSPLIASVGRLVYYKGFEQLIAASRVLDASVVIVGGGPLEAKLRGLVRSLPRVHILGTVPDEQLIRLLAAADCFVLASTSHAEAFGIATLEAQAMGVPAVVTDVGTATVEAIDPNRSGLVISPGSSSEIAAACRNILENAELGRAMSLAARRHALQNHSPAALAGRLREVYERAMHEQAPKRRKRRASPHAKS
jgi:glycosyltransferase involved in cell wall biosynthesis